MQYRRFNNFIYKRWAAYLTRSYFEERLFLSSAGRLAWDCEMKWPLVPNSLLPLSVNHAASLTKSVLLQEVWSVDLVFLIFFYSLILVFLTCLYKYSLNMCVCVRRTVLSNIYAIDVVPCGVALARTNAVQHIFTVK